jgi:hypothetical protein
MATLKDVELYLDGTRLGHISKEVNSAQPVSVPKSLESSQQRQPTVGSIMNNAGSMIGGWGDWGIRTPTGNNPNARNRDVGDREVKWSWLTPRKYFTLTHVTSTPVQIRAEVVRWVYLAGSEKPKPVRKSTLPTASSATGPTPTNSFLASLISSFASPRSNTPSRPSGRGTPVPVPAKPAPSVEKVDTKKLAAEQRKVVESSVLLSVFTAEARVKLDEKMEVELERATKKKAPGTVKVGLIYVSGLHFYPGYWWRHGN